MLWKPAVFAASVTLAVAAGAAAAERARTPADKAGAACKGTDAACLERALLTVEAGLEAARKSARSALSGGALTGDSLKKALALFEASEKDWLGQRAALCDAYELYDTALGAASPSARWSCLVNETLYRQDTLKRLFSSE